MATRKGKGPPIATDSIGSSPLWKTYTTDGSTDLDFVSDGGGPTRAIRVDTAGNYRLNHALQADPTSDATTFDDTPFQAGETQNVQAKGLVAASSPNGAKVTAYW